MDIGLEDSQNFDISAGPSRVLRRRNLRAPGSQSTHTNGQKKWARFTLDDVKTSIRATIEKTGEKPRQPQMIEHGPIADGETYWHDINISITNRIRGFEKCTLANLTELIFIVCQEIHPVFLKKNLSLQLKFALAASDKDFPDRLGMIGKTDELTQNAVRLAIVNMYPNNDPTVESLLARTEEFEARFDLAQQKLHEKREPVQALS